MTDLVDRLRAFYTETVDLDRGECGMTVMAREAADEIERLRGEVRRLQEALARATDPRTNQ